MEVTVSLDALVGILLYLNIGNFIAMCIIAMWAGKISAEIERKDL